MGLYEALRGRAKPVYSERGLVVSIGRPAPWVFLSRVEGHLTVAGARRIADGVKAQIAEEKRLVVGFHDWFGMTDYESGAWVALMDAARATLPDWPAVHFLVQSPFVSFGIRAADLILGKCTAHREERSFATAMELAVERPTRVRSSIPPRP